MKTIERRPYINYENGIIIDENSLITITKQWKELVRSTVVSKKRIGSYFSLRFHSESDKTMFLFYTNCLCSNMVVGLSNITLPRTTVLNNCAIMWTLTTHSVLCLNGDMIVDDIEFLPKHITLHTGAKIILRVNLPRKRSELIMHYSEFYLVGGAIRDFLLGKLASDYDLTYDPNKININSTFDRITVSDPINKKGTRKLQYHTSKDEYEITPFDGETIQDDIMHRDFTINALYATVYSDFDHSHIVDGSCYIVDHVGGLPDLKKKILRFVGDPNDRIKEDHSRILRFFRFQAQLRFKPYDEEQTMTIIRNHLNGLSTVPKEKIWTELEKTVEYSRSWNILKKMDSIGVFQQINIPFTGTGKFFNNAVVLFASMMNKEQWKGFCSQFKLSHKQKKFGFFIIQNICEDTKLKYFTDLSVDGYDKNWIYELIKFRCGKNSKKLHEFKRWECDNKPVFPISGDDLKDCGFSSVQIGKKLYDLKQLWKQSSYKLLKKDLLGSL